MTDAPNPSTTPGTGPVARIFTNHPATVNESYLGHMKFALGFAFWLMAAGMAALVHAIVPALCETTASRILCRLHARIEARH